MSFAAVVVCLSRQVFFRRFGGACLLWALTREYDDALFRSLTADFFPGPHGTSWNPLNQKYTGQGGAAGFLEEVERPRIY